MAKGMTTTADMANSVKTRYEKTYFLVNADPNNQGVYAQFIDWQSPIPEDGGGASSFDFPVYGEEDWANESLVEDVDVTPEKISDGNVTVTPAEWGKVFSLTKKLRYQSRTNLPEIMGKKLAMNRVGTIDRVLRRSVGGYGSSRPTQTMHIDGSSAMSDLLVTTDNVTYAWLMQLKSQAMSLGIEPFKGGQFIAPIHPLLASDIQSLTEWKSVGYYQSSDMILAGSLDRPFSLAGITFLPTRYGPLYPSAGTAAQSATTLSAAAEVGDTSIEVTSATGITAGDYLTLGTVETESAAPSSNQETVYVTSVSGTTVSVRANGKAEDFGLRFAHEAGEAVTEGTFVAGIPLIGQNSLIGVYGRDTGKYGKPIVTIGTLDTMQRFSYYAWYWYGGVGAIQKNLLLGKCAVSQKVMGVF